MADTIAGDAFADVNQLEAGWHPLLGDERARATELLARATRAPAVTSAAKWYAAP